MLIQTNLFLQLLVLEGYLTQSVQRKNEYGRRPRDHVRSANRLLHEDASHVYHRVLVKVVEDESIAAVDSEADLDAPVSDEVDPRWLVINRLECLTGLKLLYFHRIHEIQLGEQGRRLRDKRQLMDALLAEQLILVLICPDQLLQYISHFWVEDAKRVPVRPAYTRKHIVRVGLDGGRPLAVVKQADLAKVLRLFEGPDAATAIVISKYHLALAFKDEEYLVFNLQILSRHVLIRHSETDVKVLRQSIQHDQELYAFLRSE